jgi:hypothetical protein
VQHRSHHPLLHAVMQLPADPVPLIVGTLHDAPPGLAQLGRVDLQADGQLRVAEGEPLRTRQCVARHRFQGPEARQRVGEEGRRGRARRLPSAQKRHLISCHEC